MSAKFWAPLPVQQNWLLEDTDFRESYGHVRNYFFYAFPKLLYQRKKSSNVTESWIDPPLCKEIFKNLVSFFFNRG